MFLSQPSLAAFVLVAAVYGGIVVSAAAILGCYTHSHIHVSVSHEKQITMPVLSSSSWWL